MTTRNVTVSIEQTTLDHAQEAAKAAGLSLSAYFTRAADAQWLRDQGRKYRAYLANLSPEERAEMDALSAYAARRMFAAAADADQASAA